MTGSLLERTAAAVACPWHGVRCPVVGLRGRLVGFSCGRYLHSNSPHIRLALVRGPRITTFHDED